jgi:uncharacterized surface protein with fasciclin (FAS1) repeats
MRIHRSLAVLGAAVMLAHPASADWATDFDDGTRGWQVVLDGVMGGLSTGRLSTPSEGVMRFTGRLRMENNGGFSQTRTQVPASSFAGADGIELRVRGDGRTWNFDVRTSNIRMMATGYQTSFDTVDGEWTTIRLPFDVFELQSFGRRVPNGPALDPSLVESVGLTLSDKKPGDFFLEIDAIRSFRANDETNASLAMRDRSRDARSADAARPSAAADSGAGAADLATVARSAGLDTLLALVGAADFGELLPAPPFTVLAPTDEAFARLPEAEVARLLSPAGRRDLRRILSHHVIPAAVPAADAFRLRGAESLAGQTLAIEAGPSLSIGGARVLATDVAFDGGLVHVIDGVLLPELRTVADLAAATDDLSVLTTLVTEAGLLEQLGPENDGPWTVFAPVNAAFGKLPADVVSALRQRSGRAQLVSVLGFHVVPGRVRLADLPGTESLRTLSGEPVGIEFANGRIAVGGAGVIAADIETANGVVHLIDSVMLPPSIAAPRGTVASSGADTMAASERIIRALAIIERAVEIGAPLFNDGNIDACAATYTMALESVAALASDALAPAERAVLRRGLGEARDEADARERSWILRRTMDDLFTRFLERAGDV